MEKQIRILQVLGRLDRGGAETMIMNLYRCMERNRIQFDFVIHTEDVCDYTEEVKRLGGRIYSMEPFGASTALCYCRQWRQFFKEHPEYRIIHGHMRSTASLYFREAQKAGRITIAHSHNTSSGSGVSAIVKNILQYPLRYQADYLFACSKKAGIWLYGEKACEGSNFRIVKNGIRPSDFAFQEEISAKVRREMDAEDDRVLLHIGRMEEQKNHKFLIRIMKEICKRQKKIQLWLCGTGPLEMDIRKQIEEEGLAESVKVLGVRQDIPGLMQAADGMIFPSLFEGLPVTLIEAQAAGLPILMSDVITQEVILSGLVQTMSLEKDAAAWAEAAVKMLSETEREKLQRPQYVEAIVENGYDVSKNAKELAAFYDSLIQQ